MAALEVVEAAAVLAQELPQEMEIRLTQVQVREIMVVLALGLHLNTALAVAVEQVPLERLARVLAVAAVEMAQPLQFLEAV
jgi:hypothetical protein